MHIQQFVQIHIAESVSVGREKCVTETMRASDNPFASVGILARIHDSYVPIVEPSFEVVEEHLLTVPGSEDEIGKTLCGVNPHEMDEDRTAIDRHHGFGIVIREWISARPL